MRKDATLAARWHAITTCRGSGALLGIGTAAILLFSISCVLAPAINLPRWSPIHLSGRWEFWRESLALVQDYPFTGSGLASTGMVLSSYVWLLHVPFAEHVHHTFLQVAIEQGLPGVVALIALLAAAGWHLGPRLLARRVGERHREVAAASSLVALVLYGFMDSELYRSALVPLLFLPFAFVFSLEPVPRRAPTGRRLSRRAALLGGALLVATTGIVQRSIIPSARFEANMGSVAQTRAELSVYRWPDWGIQDQLRRDRVVDLEPAVARYRRALVRDPGNVTALRRLGQIYLSQGDYASAQDFLARAYGLAPDQRATRQMLGEICALGGDIEGAADWWATTGNDHGQLDARAWRYGHLGATETQQRIGRAIERLGPRQASGIPTPFRGGPAICWLVIADSRVGGGNRGEDAPLGLEQLIP